jgi:nitrite reductase/ring-hydroxylating ferredoxin subunit
MRTSDGRFFSFKNKCPHDGRKLDRIRGKNMLKCCSLRQSTFDLGGNIVSGPAKYPLEAFQVESLKDRVAIELPREAWIDWALE